MPDLWWKENQRNVWEATRHQSYSLVRDFDAYEPYEAAVISCVTEVLDEMGGHEYTEEEALYRAEQAGVKQAKWAWERLREDPERPKRRSVSVEGYDVVALRGLFDRNDIYTRRLDVELTEDEYRALKRLRSALIH